MNKLVIHNGGHPRTNDDILFLQAAIRDGLAGLSKIFGDTYYISGCGITHVGSTYTIAAGVMVYKGEVMIVDGNTVSSPMGIPVVGPVETVSSPSPVTYADTIAKDVHIVRKCKMWSSSSLPADYISINSIGQWDAGLWGQYTGVAWQTLAPIGGGSQGYTNSWDIISGLYSTFEDLKVRKTKTGLLQLIGSCIVPVGSVSTNVLQLDYAPAKTRIINCIAYDFTNFSNFAAQSIAIEITTAGVLKQHHQFGSLTGTYLMLHFNEQVEL